MSRAMAGWRSARFPVFCQRQLVGSPGCCGSCAADGVRAQAIDIYMNSAGCLSLPTSDEMRPLPVLSLCLFTETIASQIIRKDENSLLKALTVTHLSTAPPLVTTRRMKDGGHRSSRTRTIPITGKGA